jgi:hypothetical protein
MRKRKFLSALVKGVKIMYIPSYELGKEYQQARLDEAEKERLIRELKKGASESRQTKFLVGLGELLIVSGLKLKGTTQCEAPS